MGSFFFKSKEGRAAVLSYSFDHTESRKPKMLGIDLSRVVKCTSCTTCVQFVYSATNVDPH